MAPTRRNFWNRRVIVAGRTTGRDKPSEESISGGPSAGGYRAPFDRVRGARTRQQYHDLPGNPWRPSAVDYGASGTFPSALHAARDCAPAQPSTQLAVSSGASSGREGHASLASVTN